LTRPTFIPLDGAQDGVGSRFVLSLRLFPSFNGRLDDSRQGNGPFPFSRCFSTNFPPPRGATSDNLTGVPLYSAVINLLELKWPCICTMEWLSGFLSGWLGVWKVWLFGWLG